MHQSWLLVQEPVSSQSISVETLGRELRDSDMRAQLTYVGRAVYIGKQTNSQKAGGQNKLTNCTEVTIPELHESRPVLE